MKSRIAELKSKIEAYKHYTMHDRENNFTPSAVLVPLLVKNDEFELLLNKRTNDLTHHKGEISFPGGRLEKTDDSYLACALRETEEEIGLPADRVEILGELDATPVISRYMIKPFVGIVPYPFEYVKNKDEVDKIFSVPIKDFMNPEVHSITVNRFLNLTVPIHYYHVAGEMVWGATGRIVTNLLEVCFDFVPEKYHDFVKEYGDPREQMDL